VVVFFVAGVVGVEPAVAVLVGAGVLEADVLAREPEPSVLDELPHAATATSMETATRGTAIEICRMVADNTVARGICLSARRH